VGYLCDDVVGVVVAVGAGKDEYAEFHTLRVSGMRVDMA
jgi:hypothetical protein